VPTTSTRRGQVVLVRFPNSDLVTYKNRPALVVQDENVQTGLDQRLVVLITSNLDRKGVTRIRVNKNSAEGQQMGLETDSVIVADNVATIPRVAIYTAIGTCPLMGDVSRSLKQILGLN